MALSNNEVELKGTLAKLRFVRVHDYLAIHDLFDGLLTEVEKNLLTYTFDSLNAISQKTNFTSLLHILVLEQDHELIGAIAYKENKIIAIKIRTDKQQKGYGKFLLGAAATHISEDYSCSLWLESTKTSVTYYKNLGFKLGCTSTYLPYIQASTFAQNLTFFYENHNIWVDKGDEFPLFLKKPAHKERIEFLQELYSSDKINRNNSHTLAYTFKKIYSALLNGQSGIFKANFLADKNLITDDNLISLIKAEALKNPQGRTAKAWQLAHKYHIHCNGNNTALFSETYLFAFQASWAFKYSKVMNGTHFFSAKSLNATVKNGLTRKQIQASNKNINSRTHKVYNSLR